MEECTICRNRYDEGEHCPKRLDCAHTFCLTCIKIMGANGLLICPTDQKLQPLNGFEELKTNFALIPRGRNPSIKCSEHQQPSTSFCKAHLKVCCDSCVGHNGPGCVKIVIQGNEDEVKFDLRGEITRRYRAIPADKVSSAVKGVFDKRFKKEIEIGDLVSALEKTFSVMTCAGCSSSQCSYVDLVNVTIYCDACFERTSKKDDRVARDFMKCAEGEEGLKEAILTALREKLRRTDFYHLSYQSYALFSPDTIINFHDFYEQAKAVAELEHLPKGDISNLPDYFPCPLCKNMLYKENYAIYKLPCKAAFHALCADCIEREGNIITCPLDLSQFMTTDPKKELEFFEVKCLEELNPQEEIKQVEEVIERSNFQYTSRLGQRGSQFAASSEREIIGADHVLANVGTLMPIFVPRTDLSIPPDKLTFLDKYITIVPPPDPTILPESPESNFLEPWFINKYENQVEALTFAAWRGTNLWGVGITNPIENGAVGIIEYIRIYAGESAEGEYECECELLQKELIGGTGLMTDIYFKKPCPLQPFLCDTMKVKLTLRPTDPQDPLPIYHGHHIGRYEDLIGDDGTQFEVTQTICVNMNERLSGMLKIIGPIVRLIYEKDRVDEEIKLPVPVWRHPRKKINGIHELADVETPMPTFVPSVNRSLPKEKLTYLDKYILIVPPPAPETIPQSPYLHFLKPWLISKFANQVEVLTFASWRETKLWGVGITNPIANGAVGVIEYIRMYEGESAKGQYEPESELFQKELIGGTGLMTDIYFKRPYPLQPFLPVTMKVKLTLRPTDPQEPLPIYHGHHIGAYEDLIGDDGTQFEVMRTRGVDQGERSSANLGTIGPIVRLIYEKEEYRL